MQLYTEADLVSFGNSLLQKHDVLIRSSKAAPTHFAEVTHADLENWKEGRLFYNILPSRFQRGQDVCVIFGDGRFWGSILNVKFTEAKVLYDVQVYLGNDPDGEMCFTHVYGVDSAFVEPRPIPVPDPSEIPSAPIAPETV